MGATFGNMARIERVEVERIADLARLELAPDEAERMTAELEAILAYVESLRSLETDSVEPTYHAIPLATPLRDDRAGSVLAPERAVGNAPERDGFAFVVPKVLDEDEA
jgi:aspartyl-tRNA(Asn)/glutamyl-tRNA(Gln) amidotransferase subunit C